MAGHLFDDLTQDLSH